MINSSYILWMAVSALICCGVHYLLARSMKKRALLAVLTLLIGLILVPVFSRVGYCLLQWEYVSSYGFGNTLITDDMSMNSFYCGMLGAILSAILAAKCTGNGVLDALNVFAPAGALMAALARFGEYFLGLICAGNYIEESPFCFFPLSIRNEWGEWYVAVFMISGIIYLGVFALSLLVFKKKTFLRTLFYLCLPQIFCESLRNQSLIWTQFVRVEQLLCMLVVEGILIYLGIKAQGEKKRFVPAITGLVCAGVFVAVEFGVGGKILPGMSPAVFYAVMVLGLAVLAAMENWLIKLQPPIRYCSPN